jgi:outer membrane lipoprotein-sorting protein
VRRVCAGLVCLLALAGCATQREEPADPPIVRTELPKAEDVVTRYNERVRRLERVRGTLSVVIKAVNASGKKIDEQVEGNLMISLPKSLALRLDKFGETIFYMGSNDALYWWIEVADKPVAVKGRHEFATARSAEALGVPVHPLDLLELLGIITLDESIAADNLAWSADGRALQVTTPVRWGSRRLWLNPDSLEPERIELLDAEGDVTITSRLSRYTRVPVDGDAIVNARMATRYDILTPDGKTSLAITLPGPQNPGESMRARAFDFDMLLKAYRVAKTIDLDEPQPANNLDGAP